MTLTEKQHEVAKRIRETADFAWEAGEKSISTKLHGIAYYYERGEPEPDEALRDLVRNVTEGFTTFFNTENKGNS